MAYYPVFLDMTHKPALVVGGGEVAERKVQSLLDVEAKVYLISRKLSFELKVKIEDKKVTFLAAEFSPELLDGMFLVIAATDDNHTNSWVAAEAKRRGILVNVVDQPEQCTFIVPSVVRRADLVVAISTSGKSPALARKLRERLEQEFGPEYGDFLALMGRIRERVLELKIPQKERKALFQRLVDSPLLDYHKQGKIGAIRGMLMDLLPPEVPVEQVMEVISELRGE